MLVAPVDLLPSEPGRQRTARQLGQAAKGLADVPGKDAAAATANNANANAEDDADTTAFFGGTCFHTEKATEL